MNTTSVFSFIACLALAGCGGATGSANSPSATSSTAAASASSANTAKPAASASAKPAASGEAAYRTDHQSHDSSAACRNDTEPGRFDVAHCYTGRTGGRQAGKIFADWNGWVRVSASSSLQRASRSSRRTTGRCADANSIPNAAAGCTAENH